MHFLFLLSFYLISSLCQLRLVFYSHAAVSTSLCGKSYTLLFYMFRWLSVMHWTLHWMKRCLLILLFFWWEKRYCLEKKLWHLISRCRSDFDIGNELKDLYLLVLKYIPVMVCASVVAKYSPVFLELKRVRFSSHNWSATFQLCFEKNNSWETFVWAYMPLVLQCTTTSENPWSAKKASSTTLRKLAGLQLLSSVCPWNLKWQIQLVLKAQAGIF